MPTPFEQSLRDQLVQAAGHDQRRREARRHTFAQVIVVLIALAVLVVAAVV